MLREQGRYAEAMEVLEVLPRTHPEEADRWRRELALLRVARGDAATGLAELWELAEKSPEQVQGWLVFGREARIEGRFVESQAALDRAQEVCESQSCEDLAEIEYQRFLLFKDMSQIDNALSAWEKAAELDPDRLQTIREVYTLLADSGRYTEAQRYVARDPNALQAGLERGLIASLTGNFIEARREWQQVAGLDPDDFEYGHDAWVEAVLRLGNPLPALEWLQESLQGQFSPRLLVLAGVGWAMRGDRELAANLFQQAINLLRYQRPPKKKLDSAEWRLLDSLVTNEEVKKALKSYFAVVATLWG